MYAISATITHHTKNSHCERWEHTKQVPTFYLDPDTQGIVDEEHACRIARDIILPLDLDYESVTVNVTAVRI